MTKIYIRPEERPKYESRGVRVYEGPKGGLYVLSEELPDDLKRELGESATENISEKYKEYVVQAFNDILDRCESVHRGDGIVFKLKDGDSIIVKGNTIKAGKWIVKGDRLDELVVSWALLSEAVRVLEKGEIELPRIEGGLFDVGGIAKVESLEQALALVSISRGYEFIRDINEDESIADAVEMFFGPWLTQNVFEFRSENVSVDELRKGDFWRGVANFLSVYFQVKHGLRIVFESSGDIKRAANIDTAAYYCKSEVHLPVDIPGKKEYGYRGIVWHEFQHALFDLVESGPVEFWAYHMAMSGKLTEYAKTNGNEAASEAWALLIEGKADDEIKEWFKRYVEEVKSWIQ